MKIYRRRTIRGKQSKFTSCKNGRCSIRKPIHKRYDKTFIEAIRAAIEINPVNATFVNKDNRLLIVDFNDFGFRAIINQKGNIHLTNGNIDNKLWFSPVNGLCPYYSKNRVSHIISTINKLSKK